MCGKNLSHALQRKPLADGPKIQHAPGFETFDEWSVLIERNDPAQRSRDARTRLHRIDHGARAGIEPAACCNRSLDRQAQAPVALVAEEKRFAGIHRIDAADVASRRIAAEHSLEFLEFLKRLGDRGVHKCSISAGHE